MPHPTTLNINTQCATRPILSHNCLHKPTHHIFALHTTTSSNLGSLTHGAMVAAWSSQSKSGNTQSELHQSEFSGGRRQAGGLAGGNVSARICGRTCKQVRWKNGTDSHFWAGGQAGWLAKVHGLVFAGLRAGGELADMHQLQLPGGRVDSLTCRSVSAHISRQEQQQQQQPGIPAGSSSQATQLTSVMHTPQPTHHTTQSGQARTWRSPIQTLKCE